MIKINKSQLLKELEETSMSYQYLSEITSLNSAPIIDFMALRNTRFETSGEIAKSLALTIFLIFF